MSREKSPGSAKMNSTPSFSRAATKRSDVFIALPKTVAILYKANQECDSQLNKDSNHQINIHTNIMAIGYRLGHCGVCACHHIAALLRATAIAPGLQYLY